VGTKTEADDPGQNYMGNCPNWKRKPRDVGASKKRVNNNDRRVGGKEPGGAVSTPLVQRRDEENWNGKKR